MELTLEQETEIVHFLIDHCNAYAVMIFGSAANGQMRHDSDVDVAFLAKGRMAAYECFMAAQRLSERLKREVDLVDFTRASTVLQAQIVSTGKILYDSETVRRQAAYMVALKAYALLN
jgi:predicted nucleotidyltransferase